jgi:hypothetical protein
MKDLNEVICSVVYYLLKHNNKYLDFIQLSV